MTRVLGLDVSTSCVGVAVLNNDPMGINIDILDHLVFPPKVKTLWEKAEILELYLTEVYKAHSIDQIYIEDAAKKFTKGLSSATTIAVCMRFNGMATYITYSLFKLHPEYIAPASARKGCGLKMQQKKKCGKSHKEQTFDAMMASDLKHLTWPTKQRSTNIVDWAYDTVDAYVVAKAGLLMNK